MAKKKAKITKIKQPKIAKFKTYKPKKVTIKMKSIKTQKAPKVGQKIYKTLNRVRGVAKATKNTGSALPITPRSMKLNLN